MLFGITYLRAVAAFSVVLWHVVNALEHQRGLHLGFSAKFLQGGVDLFFVISGFLMVYTTRGFKESSIDWKNFILKRLLRVGPLYWIMTLLIFGAFLVDPGISQKPIGWTTFFRSMFFIPSDFKERDVTTIVTAGWTLCYEMFFYLLFAIFLGLNYCSGIKFLCAVLVALVCINPYVSGNFYVYHYSNPLMLEFVFGMLIAMIPKTAFVALTAIIGAVLMVFLDCFIDHRVISYGVGAALIVWATVSSRVKFDNKWVLLVGDASYSIYLTHLFAIRIALKVFPGSVVTFVASLLLAVAGGLLTFLYVERPLSEFASRWLAGRSHLGVRSVSDAAK